MNFDPVAANNVVYFGAERAVVTGASATNLAVMVPVGATYAPITETVNGLTAYSGISFLPTFSSGGPLNNASLGPRVNMSAGSGPARVVIGDLDGDGKPDVVAANVYDGSVWIYQNISTNGTLAAASFAAPVIFTIGGGSDSLYGLALADADGDGRLDIVTANRNLNIVSIFQNMSSPGSLTTNSFAARVDFPVAGAPMGVAVGDLDGDGRLDIITADYGSNAVSVLRNLGLPGGISTNSFGAAVNYATGSTPTWVAVADMDGDGKPDLITANGSSSATVSILRNTSILGGVSSAPEVDFAGLGSGNSLAIGDLDGDGKPDVVCSCQPSGQAVSVYRNTSTPGNITTGSLAAHVDFATGGWANTVAIADLDGDGKLDLVVAAQLGSHLSVFRNQSTPGSLTTGSFGARLDFVSGYNPNGIAIGDLDGDGRPDIVFGNTYDNTLSLYRNVIPFGTAPVISSQPTNQTVTVKGNAVFNVTTSSGTMPLSYQWSLNMTNIVGATNAMLTLTNVQFSQAGVYAVKITNNFGSVLSSNALLVVNDKLDHFVWSQIPSPRFKNAPFAVVVQAMGTTNEVFTNFTGVVHLSSTNGVPVNPPVSAAFVQGKWMGSVTVSQLAANLVLQADDGLGESGLANAINIVNPPSLGMTQSGNTLFIYWPVASSNFVLETSASLAPAQWTQVASPAVQISDQYLQSIQMTNASQFYRLRLTVP